MEIKKGNIRAHLIIKGWVQGVFFRATTGQEAVSLAITGWVRNCRDGSVECLLEGDRIKVDKLIKWCHHGPPGARVTDVDVRWEEYADEFDSFSIR